MSGLGEAMKQSARHVQCTFGFAIAKEFGRGPHERQVLEMAQLRPLKPEADGLLCASLA